MKFTRLFSIILPAIFSISLYAADKPILCFSDIVGGPKTGNSDVSLGQTANQHGAIVTIWGKNLGSTQGTSEIWCNGAKAAYVYSWKNADKPADLFSYHKMQ